MTKSAKGEIYIGVLIAIGIFLILSQAVVSLMFSSFDLISFNKARTNAKFIASEQIELIRNLSFEDVGTIGGIPAGNLPQNQTRFINGLTYNIKISIVYVDDSFDNQAPIDLLPNDYKRARVDVSWGGLAASNENTVTLITDIAPNGIETTTGGGTISILVFDSQGEAVPEAKIQIEAPSLNPPIDLELETNQNGVVILPGAPICNSCYRITISKDGFSSERTYSTDEITNPTKPDVTVLESQLTEISFAIDEFANFTLNTKTGIEGSFSNLGGQIVRVYGTKILGTNELDEPIYKFDNELVTNGSGTINIPEMEWDTYTIELPDDSTRVISASTPIAPVEILPNFNVNLNIGLSPKTDFSLWALFIDSNNNPIDNLEVTILDGGVEIETQLTGTEEFINFGQVFFSNLENKNYTINAIKEGYEDYSGTIDVSTNTYETIIINEIE